VEARRRLQGGRGGNWEVYIARSQLWPLWANVLQTVVLKLLHVAVTSQLGLKFQKTEFWFGVSKLLATLGGPLRGRIVFQ
jgi:hypothetical protein